MINLIELESRWLKYKIKSYIPHLSIFISLIVILVLIVSFMNQYTKNDTNDIVKPAPNIETVVIIKKPEPKKSIVVTKVLDTPVTSTQIDKEERSVNRVTPSRKYAEKTLKLSPSLDFMKKMQNSVQPYYMNEHTNSNDILPVVKKEKPIKKVVKKEKKVELKPTTNTTHRINIQRQNTQHDIADIVKRFKTNNNPALSLFVAKKYYELGNYQQAYNYALITNKINKDIEVSWIIFSKSLVKLGEKNKAISILSKYIEQSHSSSAQILLDDIRTGKFQ